MADWHSVMGKEYYSERPVRDEEFNEEDVWGVLKEGDDSSPSMKKSKELCFGSPSAWRLSSAPRVIPRASSPTNPENRVVQQSSAPLDIPDWSKIYGKNANMGSWTDHANHGNRSGIAFHHNMYDDGVDDDDDKEEEDGIVPPHKYIAKRLARSHISSFSVCEGIGRTLKGRDLSKLRNTILTKTGFLE